MVGAVAPSTVRVNQIEREGDVDFEALTKSVIDPLPEDPSQLRDELVALAEGINQQLSPITVEAIEQATDPISKANELARRTEFAIEILHNNDLGEYLDDAWVTTFRNHISVVTKILPLVGGFNNLYHHAKVLDSAAATEDSLAAVDGEKFENFGLAIAAFGIEVGLWSIGAPYQMAWKGTRFVSNRTLLRGINYLDNRLVALVMSEIHWKIREKVYETISVDNMKATLGKFSELRKDAREIELREEDGTYLDLIEVNVTEEDFTQYDFVEQSNSRPVVGGPVESSGGGILSDLFGGFNLPSFDLGALLSELL